MGPALELYMSMDSAAPSAKPKHGYGIQIYPIQASAERKITAVLNSSNFFPPEKPVAHIVFGFAKPSP